MKKIGQSLYTKFLVVILVVGFLPMFILATFAFNNMLKEYRNSVNQHYTQAVTYISSNFENYLSRYDNATKLMYNYNYNFDVNYYFTSYDNFRQLLFESDKNSLKANIDIFFSNIQNMDSHIEAIHFIGIDSKNDSKIAYHYSNYNPYFRNSTEFENAVDIENWNTENTKLEIVPVHTMSYYGSQKNVISVGRNYFDNRGEIIERKYIGTIFLDVNVDFIAKQFDNLELNEDDNFYIFNNNGECIFSDNKDFLLNELNEHDLYEQLKNTQFYIYSDYNEYGIKTLIVLDEKIAFKEINSMKNMMYLFIALTALILVFGAIYFSKKLTMPIRNMTKQMREIEKGNFDIEIPVLSNDEIGMLSERFNKMSKELKIYIDKYFNAKINQTEAELNALKMQIYPHFLYNTLEVIRMSALDQDDTVVAKMIEALSKQIRYLIGPLKDNVPIKEEISIINSYVYLLNCRTYGDVNLNVELNRNHNLVIPKLILQPIVENAYLHGLKPKNGVGDILIEVTNETEGIKISIIDNGVGMTKDDLDNIEHLIAGTDIGIKKDYYWQSISLKNVNDRIKYLYGEEFGVKVSSKLNIGTIVSITIPDSDEEEV